jgi:ribosomal protein L9
MDTHTDAHNTAPGIGHNQPPAPLTSIEIVAFLNDALAGLTTRRNDVIAALLAGSKAHPVINDDETLGSVAENVRMASTLLRTSDQRRKEQKEPFLEGGRTVDGWFKTFLAPLSKAIAPVQAAMDEYGARKLKIARADAERKRLAAEAEATRATQAALTAKTPEDSETAWDLAADAAARAEQANKKAAVRPAAMTRTHGTYGAVSSVRSSWRWEITDAALIPRAYLTTDEAAIREAGRARDASGKPIVVIPGIAWVETTKVGVR